MSELHCCSLKRFLFKTWKIFHIGKVGAILSVSNLSNHRDQSGEENKLFPQFWLFLQIAKDAALPAP